MRQSDKKYLETIYSFDHSGKTLRAIDIGKSLEVSRASVSKALKRLEEQKLIYIDLNKSITLTSQGKEKAYNMHQKQVLIEHFLEKVINVSKEVAKKDAYKMKHCISEEVFQEIHKFLLDW